jgi:tripartite-type tricarboxylate transporter receptor subunit TctC
LFSKLEIAIRKAKNTNEDQEEIHMQNTYRMALAIAGILLAAPVKAQDKYPSRVVEIINPYQAGGTTDALARALGAGMSTILGQQFIISNRPGAGGTVGSAQIARSNPDGYKILFAPALVVSVLPQVRTRAEVGYDATDLVPVCQTFSNTMGLIVKDDSPIRNIKDLVAAARAKPDGLSYGHQGVATIPQLAMEEFLENAKIKIAGIPARGDPAVMNDLLGGQIDVATVVLGAVGIIGQNARIIGVFSDERHPSFPDAPTVPEQGYNVTPTSFGGLFVPKGTPESTIEVLSTACEKAAKDETYKATAMRAAQPVQYLADRPTFAKRLQQDVEIKQRLLKQLGQTAQ